MYVQQIDRSKQSRERNNEDEKTEEWFDPEETPASFRDSVMGVHPGLVLRARLSYCSIRVEYAGEDKRKVLFYGPGGGYYNTRFMGVDELVRLLGGALSSGACLKREKGDERQ